MIKACREAQEQEAPDGGVTKRVISLCMQGGNRKKRQASSTAWGT